MSIESTAINPCTTPSSHAVSEGLVAAIDSRGVHSIWFQLGLSLLAGVLYTIAVLGPGSLNPRNINWLTPDPACQFISWELFRQDQHPRWPLTYTDRLGFPKGEAVALTDLNPLLALILKPLSPLLPEPFQYFGLETVLVCALQFFFAVRLLRLILGRNGTEVWLAGLFFLVSPVLAWRLVQHYALANQWLLIAGLLVFFLAQQPGATGIRRFSISAVILSGIAIGTNPYIALQVLAILMAAVCSLLWTRRLGLRGAAAITAALAAVALGVSYVMGFIIHGGYGYTASGYGYFSMNVLSPVDPQIYGSSFLHKLPHATAGQYEGYNYLGAGVIALAAVVLALLLARWEKWKLPALSSTVPLGVCCAALTLMALSTNVSVGSKVLFKSHAALKLVPYLAALRATGRLFWLCNYLILTVLLVAPFRLVRRSVAISFLVVALAIQVVDLIPLRDWLHRTANQTYPSPLKSPIWSRLGESYQNLMVIPAWQCESAASPGGKYGYRTFGFLAVSQRMRINSYYSARYTESNRDYHCGQEIARLERDPLAADTAYVVTPDLAALIAEGPSGPGKCHDLDGFVLCLPKVGFGLSPVLKTTMTTLQNWPADPGFEGNDISAWKRYLGIEAEPSTDRAHTGTHSLAEIAGVGSVYQDISGLQPGKTYTVTAWAAASPGTTASAQLAIFDVSRNQASFSSAVLPGRDWWFVSCSATAGQSGKIRVHLLRSQGSGRIYWDDVRLYAEKSDVSAEQNHSSRTR